MCRSEKRQREGREGKRDGTEERDREREGAGSDEESVDL